MSGGYSAEELTSASQNDRMMVWVSSDSSVTTSDDPAHGAKWYGTISSKTENVTSTKNAPIVVPIIGCPKSGTAQIWIYFEEWNVVFQEPYPKHFEIKWNVSQEGEFKLTKPIKPRESSTYFPRGQRPQ